MVVYVLRHTGGLPRLVLDSWDECNLPSTPSIPGVQPYWGGLTWQNLWSDLMDLICLAVYDLLFRDVEGCAIATMTENGSIQLWLWLWSELRCLLNTKVVSGGGLHVGPPRKSSYLAMI